MKNNTNIQCVVKAIDWLVFDGVVKNQRELADKLGYTESSFSQIINGKVALSERFIKKLYDFDTRLNFEWLLTGEGEMLKSAKNSFSQMTAEELKSSTTVNYRLVPMYNLDARGGFDSNDVVDSVEYIADRIPFKDAQQDDICVMITGNSMSPTYCAGSVVLLHPIDRWREFLDLGQVYVIILEDGRRLIKELRTSEENKRSNYLCKSHNPNVDPVELPKSMIRRVFIVAAVYSKTIL